MGLRSSFTGSALLISLLALGCGSSSSASSSSSEGGHSSTSSGHSTSTGAGSGGDASSSTGDATSSNGSGAATSGTGGSGAGTTTGSGGSGAAATQSEGLYFPAGAVYYQDVSGSNATVASDSDAITQWMVGKSGPDGWGTGTFRVDFSIVAVDVPEGTAKRTYSTVADFNAMPDCDTAPIPVPQGGAVEGDASSTVFTSQFSGYQCGGFDDGDDCHMLFVSRSEKRLYEVYHGTIDGQGQFQVGCLALWDLSKVYDKNGRGQQCTSADAAGLPMAPLLFTAEEIKAGAIHHAIRFILPNNMIRAKKYVSPATHGTNTSGPDTAPPYGARFRLKAGYDLSQLSPAAQVVAKALQKYGMIHADGGNIALTAQSDVLSTVKWADVGFDSQSLVGLKATDFEVLDAGTPYDVTYDCQRTVITQ